VTGHERVDTSVPTPPDEPLVIVFTAEDEYGFTASPVERTVGVINPCAPNGERICRVAYLGSRCSVANACLADVLLVSICTAAPTHSNIGYHCRPNFFGSDLFLAYVRIDCFFNDHFAVSQDGAYAGLGGESSGIEAPTAEFDEIQPVIHMLTGEDGEYDCSVTTEVVQ
jgi:hypothetical protein